MKTYTVLFFIALTSVAVAQDNKTPYMTKSLSGEAIRQVFVNTSGGSITVSGAAGEKPRVEVYVSGNNMFTPSNDQVKKRLEDDYKLDITVSGGALHASAKSKHDGNWDWRKSLSLSFKVYVQENVSTTLETSGGSIHLNRLKGEENFNTSGGSLHLNELSGKIHGRTSGGSIQVSNSGDNLDLETSGGSIHADNCSGKIKLETSGGSLNMEKLDGDIEATTSGGSVHANSIKGSLKTGTSGGSVGLSDLACSLDAYTSGGSMHVQMVQLGKFVKIDASSGHVDLQLPNKGMDLDLHGYRVEAEFSGNFLGTKEKDKVEGKLNGGGAPVHIDGSGRVSLKFN